MPQEAFSMYSKSSFNAVDTLFTLRYYVKRR
jgi:hypothetical protein